MNASKVGLKKNFKKTKILHAGHNSQPSPVTTINGYTLEICNDFLYLGISTKTPLSVAQEKIVEHGLQSANSDLFSFPKSVMLTRCALLEPRLKQLQHMDWNQSHNAFVMSANRRVPSSIGPGCIGHYLAWYYIDCELTQRAKLIPFSRTIRMRRLRVVGHVIRMQSRCQAPLGTLLTTVPSNCHLRQGHGRTSTLQHNVADDLRSINSDVTSISGMTKSCFFNLVDTLDWFMFNVYVTLHFKMKNCW